MRGEKDNLTFNPLPERLLPFGLFYFMVEYKLKEHVIEIKITNAIDWNITTEFEAPSRMYAILLHNSIMENQSKSLQKIRREAYEQGWKDAKAKVKKSDWFSGWW